MHGAVSLRRSAAIAVEMGKGTGDSGMASGGILRPRAGGTLATARAIGRRLFTWQVALGAVLVIAVCVRVPFFRVPLVTDEGGYAYTTHRGLIGGDSLYHLLWFDRTQGILWVYRVIFETLGKDLLAIRLFAALYNALSALLVYVIGRRLGGKRVGLIAAFLFGLFSVMPHMEAFTANAELFMTLPALASLALLLPLDAVRLHATEPLRARRNRDAARRIALSGVCAGAAFVIKPAEAAALIVGGVLLLVAARRGDRSWRALLRPQVIFGAAAAVGILPAVVDGIVRDGHAYLAQVLLYRGAEESIISPNSLGRLSHSVWSTIVVGGDVLPLVLLAVLALTIYRRALPADARLLAPAWLGASFFGVALGGNWYGHYFFQMLPPLALYAAFALRAAFVQGTTAVWRQRLVVAVSLSVMLTASYTGRYFVAQPAELATTLYQDRLYEAQDPLVAYLKEHTRASDQIYVAFEGPSIYYLSERQSAFPVIWRQPVLSDPATFNRLMATLDTPAGPAYIVDLDAPRYQRAHERLRPILERRYRLAAIIGGVQVYERVPSTWDVPWTMRVDR